MWRCLRNALATKLNLHRRHCAPSPSCQLCSGPEENALHCLFLCPHAAATWHKMFPSLGPPPNLTQWIFSLRKEDNLDLCRKKIFCLWNIWKARNEFIFRRVVPAPFLTAICAFRDAAEPCYNPPPVPSFTQPRNIPPQSCPPPLYPQKRIFCDGSFDHMTQEAAFGVVITNSNGQICDGKAGRISCSSPIEAEAHAILEVCHCALENPSPSVIMSDGKIRVDALNGEPADWPWRCYAALSSISRILHLSTGISVSFTSRQNNKCADWVARNCRLNGLHPEWLHVLNVVTALL
ncbi:unnamed protein product [Linum trigynum]|uniref:RNase H type-1 domain-containing protein n=1 Tax=Linum trigynum TaxID=586398 RepID=A0AAV2DIY2_9ROSI